MSRSGYAEDEGDGALNVWRGAVASALRGRRGQAFLREMRDAMDAMPEKRLAAEVLAEPDGEVCAMGTVVMRRGLDVSDVDPDDYEIVAERLGLAEAMVREIAYLNDEHGWIWDAQARTGRMETPEERWARMREWVERQIAPTEPTR